MNPTDHTPNTTNPNDDENTSADLATVHHLPNTGEVLEGEFVSDQEWALLTTQKEQAFERYRGYRSDVVRFSAATKRVAKHDRTTSTLKFAGRHATYVGGGAIVVAKRVWEAKTNSRYERLMRTAEAKGSFEELSHWEERAEQAKERRHNRAMAWLDAPKKVIKAGAQGLAAGVVLLFLLGVILATAHKDIGFLFAPFGAVIDAVSWTVLAFSVAWGPFILAAPWLAVAMLHFVGRRAEATFEGLKTAAQRVVGDVLITPSVVVTALRDVGVSELRKAIKEMGDGGAGMLGPIKIAGCGVEVDVTLPSGVSTEEIQRRRRKLAENLGRHEHEVFITIPTAARTVRLWIADSGALDEPIGPSALVTDPDVTSDLYSGTAPWGQDLRGDAVRMKLLQCHLLITGLSNQGKTAALRALVLWLILDAANQIHLADLKGLGDWRMFKGIAKTLIEGPTDEHCMQATHMLEWGVTQMETRLTSLDSDKYPDGVPRELARPGGPFEPIFLVVDEAQQAFMCPAVGDDKRPYGGTKKDSRYFMAARKLHNQGRAVNVHLWQGTQDPTDQNLPKLVREGAHIRASLVVGTEEQARMALGDKAVNGGAAPHKLRQGLDKGTLVVTGTGVPLPAGQASMTVRTNFINGTEAVEIADRARTIRGAVQPVAVEVDEDRDVLADVAAVMGTEVTVKVTDVVARLRELAPDDKNYSQMAGLDLKEALDELGVPVKKVDGVLTVRARLVQLALAERDAD